MTIGLCYLMLLLLRVWGSQRNIKFFFFSIDFRHHMLTTEAIGIQPSNTEIILRLHGAINFRQGVVIIIIFCKLVPNFVALQKFRCQMRRTDFPPGLKAFFSAEGFLEGIAVATSFVIGSVPPKIRIPIRVILTVVFIPNSFLS